MVRLLLAAVLMGALAACASLNERQDQYRSLSPEAQGLFDKYRQFMTKSAEEQYLAAPDDDQRRKMVADMHVEERLSRFPPFIQTAIWSRTPVLGMDKRALFLCLGLPDSVDRDDIDPATHILPTEHWFYRRGPLQDETYEITLVNDEISEIKAPKIR